MPMSEATRHVVNVLQATEVYEADQERLGSNTVSLAPHVAAPTRYTAGMLTPLATATPTSVADCTLNGQPVPCDQLAHQFGAFFLGFGLFFMFLMMFCLALGLAGFILTLVMIIHAAQHEIKDRALWIVLMVVFGPVAAVIYYFAVKRPFDELQRSSAKPASRRRTGSTRSRRRSGHRRKS